MRAAGMVSAAQNAKLAQEEDADAMRKHRESWLRKMQHKLPRPPVADRAGFSATAVMRPAPGPSATGGAGRTRRLVEAPKSPETEQHNDDDDDGDRELAALQSESQAALPSHDTRPAQQAREGHARDGELLRRLYEKDRLIKGLQRNIDKLSSALKQARAQVTSSFNPAQLPPPSKPVANADTPLSSKAISNLPKESPQEEQQQQKEFAREDPQQRLFAQSQSSPRGSARESQLQAQLREAQTKVKNLLSEISNLRGHAHTTTERIASLEATVETLAAGTEALEAAKLAAETSALQKEAQIRAEAEKVAQAELFELRRENVKILNELAASKGEVVLVRKQLMQVNTDSRQTQSELEEKLRQASLERADLARSRARGVDRIAELEQKLEDQRREVADLQQKLLIKFAAQAAHLVPIEKLEAELALQKRETKRREDAIAFQRRQQVAESAALRKEIDSLRAATEAADQRVKVLLQDSSKVALEALHERLRAQERANEDLGRRAERDRQLCVELERKVADQESGTGLAFGDVRQSIRDLLATERAILPQCVLCGAGSGLQPHRCQSCEAAACGACAKKQPCRTCASGGWKLDVDLVAATSQAEFRISRLEAVLRALGA